MAWRSQHAHTYEEDTYEHKRLHVDPTALSHVSDIMKRLRRSKGFFGPQFAWYDKSCLSYNVRLAYNPSQVNADKCSIEQAIAARDVLKPVVDALEKISSRISSAFARKTSRRTNSTKDSFIFLTRSYPRYWILRCSVNIRRIQRRRSRPSRPRPGSRMCASAFDNSSLIPQASGRMFTTKWGALT